MTKDAPSSDLDRKHTRLPINCGARLAISLALLTVGVGIMLIGINSLFFLGLIFVILSDSVESGRRARLRILLVLLAGVVLGLFEGSRAFTRTPRDGWFVAVFIAIWLWGVISAALKYRAYRKLKP